MPVVVALPPVQLGHTGRLLCAAPGRRAPCVVRCGSSCCWWWRHAISTGFSSCRGHRAELLAITVMVAVRKDAAIMSSPEHRGCEFEIITCSSTQGAVMANAGSMVRRRCEHMRPGHSTLPLVPIRVNAMVSASCSWIATW